MAAPLTTAMRYKDLGGAMLKQVATAATAPVSKDALPADLDNRFTLSVLTRSGARVDLTLGNVGDEMHFQISASDELGEDERKALYGLAAGFQAAIDAMAQDEPQVRLAGLTQIDPQVLRSRDFHAELKLGAGPDTQALDFHIDGAQRKVSIDGPRGKADVTVDTSKLASLGTKEQQSRAINRYLQQFDQAALRGRGDARLMGMFKDAFSDMARTATKSEPPTPGSQWDLSAEDHAVLTGLADFSASVTQTPKWSNPLRLAETDSFAYEVSQDTAIGGNSRDERSISQAQASHLAAQFHDSLKKDAELKLDVAPQSQNYEYHQIADSAHSKVELGYKDGRLVRATLEQSVSQSERIRKYVQGKLMTDHTIPAQQNMVRDLMSTLAPYRSGENDRAREESREARDERRLQSLDALSGEMLLLSSPWDLSARDQRW